MARAARALLFVAGVAVLAFVVSRFPLAGIGDAAARLAPWGFCTPLIALGWFCANAAALRAILANRVKFGPLLWNRLVGEGYNSLLPLGDVAGDVIKIRHLSRLVGAHPATCAIFHARAVESAVGFAYSAACVALGLGRFHAPGLWVYVPVGGAISIAAAVVALSRLPSAFSVRLLRWFAPKSEIQDIPVLPLSAFLRSAGWILVGRALGLCEIVLLLHLLGLPADPAACFFLHGALAAAGFVFSIVPTNIGVQEASTIYIFQLMGQAGTVGLAFALARRGRLLLVALGGVLLHHLTPEPA